MRCFKNKNLFYVRRLNISEEHIRSRGSTTLKKITYDLFTYNLNLKIKILVLFTKKTITYLRIFSFIILLKKQFKIITFFVRNRFRSIETQSKN